MDDISLNTGPFSNAQLFKQDEWQAFSSKGLHLIHLNIDSLLPKIVKLRDIAKRTKYKQGYKLDSIVLDPGIFIENYKIVRFSRNQHGGGIRSYFSYKLNSCNIQ